MNTRAARTRPERHDTGFTLIELVVTVAIVGIIAVALSGVVLSYLRTTTDTAARLSESHDVQLAAAYWQRDVASIGVRSATYDDAVGVHSFALMPSVGLSACGLPSGASAVVTLGWSQYSSPTSTDAPTLVRVTWATRAGADGFELVRVRCGPQPSTETVAHHLVAAPTVTCRNASSAAISCGGSGSSVPAMVDLRMTTLDTSARTPQSYQATLSGERRQS